MLRIQKDKSLLNIPSISITNTFGNVGSGLESYGLDLEVDVSNNVYVGGIFGTAGGIAVNRVAMWNGTAWVALGSASIKGVRYSIDPVGTRVNAMVFDNSNNLIVGGLFDQVGNFVEANRIARWNGVTWDNLSPGNIGITNGLVSALVYDNSNNLYVGGSFTSAGGISANRIARWNGSSWSALGSGIGIFSVYALAVDNQNNLFVGGDFTTAGGISANYIAKWDGSSWSALGSGANSLILGLTFDNSNNLYACGVFTTIGGIPANFIAKWNGTSWSALPSQVNGVVYNIKFKNNKLYVSGNFTQAGGADLPYFSIWDGTSWSGVSSNLNANVNNSAIDNNGKIYITGEFTTPGSRIAQQVQSETSRTITIPSESANSKRIGII
jgi:hypothetical protein